MGGGGSILSMIISYKNNLSLRNNKRKAFEKWKKTGKSKHLNPIPSKDISHEELQTIKKEIERKLKLQRKRIGVSVVAFTLLVFIGLTILVIHKVRSVENQMNEKRLESLEQQNAAKQEKEMALLELLNMGYKKVQEKNYKEAKIILYKAYKYNTDDYRAVYAIAKIYVLDCIENGVECQTADQYLSILNDQFGEKAESIALTKEFEKDQVVDK